MADISTELQRIKSAVYGEEVRGSIVDALGAMNEIDGVAEAWATGGSGGTPSATNNSKYYQEQAAASAAAAADSAASFTPDPTLSIQGKPADAKATGDAIDELTGRVNGIEDIAGNDYSIADDLVFNDGKAVGANNGNLSGLTENYSYTSFFSCGGYSGIRITLPVITASSTSIGIAFYKYANRETGSYVSGVIVTYDAAEAGVETRTIEIPADANYFATTWWISTSELYDQFACSLIKEGELGELEATVADVENRVDGIEDLTGTVRDISGLITLRDGSIIKKSDGTAQSGAGYSRTNDYVNITGYSKLRLTIPVITSSTTSLGMAFYRSASTEEGSYISGNNVVYNAAEAGWELREYDIPEGANYFRSTWWGSSNALYSNFHCELVKNGAVTTMVEQDVTGTTVSGYVKEENGSFASSTSYTRTRLIPVFSGCSYYYTGRIYSGICVAGYDMNKVFVGPVLSTAGTYRDQLLTIPDTVKYIAACRINSDSPALKVVCRGELLSAVYETAADEANEYFPNMQPEEMTSVSLFERIGVLGDSYSCGAIYDIQGATGGVHMNMSWPKILGRMSGTTCIPYADPGTTAKTFLTKSMCMPQLLADPACNLYLFMLGINTETTGTIADINDADYTQNADTFYGNMGRIYMQIIEHAPKAKVIFIKFPFKGTTAHWDAVEEIAEHYSCPCIDAGKEKYFSSPFYSSSSHQGSGHPVGVTYAGMAKAMRRQIEKCMVDNFDYFKNYTGND